MKELKFKKKNAWLAGIGYVFTLLVVSFLTFIVPYLTFWSLNTLFDCSFNLHSEKQYIAFWILVIAISLFFEHVGKQIGKHVKGN
jgi:magnesium-transporting ATPase (P-type)